MLCLIRRRIKFLLQRSDFFASFKIRVCDFCLNREAAINHFPNVGKHQLHLPKIIAKIKPKVAKKIVAMFNVSGVMFFNVVC